MVDNVSPDIALQLLRIPPQACSAAVVAARDEGQGGLFPVDMHVFPALQAHILTASVPSIRLHGILAAGASSGTRLTEIATLLPFLDTVTQLQLSLTYPDDRAFHARLLELMAVVSYQRSIICCTLDIHFALDTGLYMFNSNRRRVWKRWVQFKACAMGDILPLPCFAKLRSIDIAIADGFGGLQRRGDVPYPVSLQTTNCCACRWPWSLSTDQGTRCSLRAAPSPGLLRLARALCSLTEVTRLALAGPRCADAGVLAERLPQLVHLQELALCGHDLGDSEVVAVLQAAGRLSALSWLSFDEGVAIHSSASWKLRMRGSQDDKERGRSFFLKHQSVGCGGVVDAAAAVVKVDALQVCRHAYAWLMDH